MILNALKTIGRGFLLGVGFSIAMCGISGAAWILFDRQSSKDVEAAMGEMDRESTKDIAVSEVEEQKHDGAVAILGSIKNNGPKPHSHVELKANLFNHGKFVDQYSTYVSGTIEPGASAYFKISCGCNNSPPAEHDSFKVEVVKGF